MKYKYLSVFDAELSLKVRLRLPVHLYYKAIKDPHYAQELLEECKECYEDEDKTAIVIFYWTTQECSTLIKIMSNYLEDLNDPLKRKNVFELIANDLLSEGFDIDARSTEIKWKYLMKIYRKAKDKQEKTGNIQSEFPFFDEMDEILGQQHQCDNLENTKTEAGNRYVWLHDETYKLIEIISFYIEDLKHPDKKEMIFKLAAKTLNFLGISVDASAVENMWITLLNSYTEIIERQSKFQFFDSMHIFLKPSSMLNSDFKFDSNDFISLNESFKDFLEEENEMLTAGSNSGIDILLSDIERNTANSKLMNILPNYSEDLKHPKKRRNVFELVARDMNSDSLKVDAIYVRNMWKYLVKHYRKAKLTNNDPSQFTYFNQMEDLLGPDPVYDSDCSVCSVDFNNGPIDAGSFVEGDEENSAGRTENCHQDEEKQDKTIYSPDWTREETSTLIKVMSNYSTDLKDAIKRKHVFELVESDLRREGFAIDAKSIEIKWKSLVTSYNKNKAKQARTGSCRFRYYYEMDGLLGKKHQLGYVKSGTAADNSLFTMKSSSKNINLWSFDETYKLIDLMSEYSEDLKNPIKRSVVFEMVTMILNLIGLTVDESSVKNKWSILFGSYKKMKDKPKGKKQSRFLFFDTMNNLLRQKSNRVEYQFRSDDFKTISENLKASVKKDDTEATNGAKLDVNTAIEAINSFFRSSEKNTKLIETIRNYMDDLKHPDKRENVYELVAEDMTREGFEVDAYNVKQHWKSLVSQYKVAKVTNNQPIQCFYYEKMQDLLGKNSFSDSDYSNNMDMDDIKETDDRNEVTELDVQIAVLKHEINELQSAIKELGIPEDPEKHDNFYIGTSDTANFVEENFEKKMDRQHLKHIHEKVKSIQIGFNDILDKSEKRKNGSEEGDMNSEILEMEANNVSMNANDSDLSTTEAANFVEKEPDDENLETELEARMTAEIKDICESLSSVQINFNDCTDMISENGEKDFDELPAENLNFEDSVHDSNDPESFYNCDVDTSGTPKFEEKVEENNAESALNCDENRVKEEENSVKIFNSDYLRMKKAEYAKRQQRHEEIMEIERKKLKIMEDFIKSFDKK